MKKKLMVAGCSFSAVSNTHPGTSWSELLAKRLDWDLINLARQGCSNGGIRIQIDEILRIQPDFAIVTPTFWDRMEIPAQAAPYDWGQPSTGWDPPLQRHLQNSAHSNGYNRSRGIDNVNYGTNPYGMICETIFTLAENYPHPYRSGLISRTAQAAVRAYIDAIYDTAWKKQQDEWIIREGVWQLSLSGIPFLINPVLLWPWDPDQPAQWRSAFPDSIATANIVTQEPESVLSISGRYPFTGEDPGYHTSAAGQAHIADCWYNRILALTAPGV